jgi:hypothetical protein
MFVPIMTTEDYAGRVELASELGDVVCRTLEAVQGQRLWRCAWGFLVDIMSTFVAASLPLGG